MENEEQLDGLLLPLGGRDNWFVPVSAVAEVLIVPGDSPIAPKETQWRDKTIPVLSYIPPGDSAWHKPSIGGGIVAVMVGFVGEAHEFYGVALTDLPRDWRFGEGSIEEVDTPLHDTALQSFTFQKRICHVPNLSAIQRGIPG